jgi:hypothetical protein
MNRYRLALVAVAVLVLAVGISLYSLSKVTTVEVVDAPTAGARFETVLETFESAGALLQRNRDGAWVRGTDRAEPADAKLRRIGVLAYAPDDGKLYRMDIPFWFYRMKGPALEFVLTDTGFDLGDLGIKPRDLQDHGPGLVLDEEQADNGRIVVWVE